MQNVLGADRITHVSGDDYHKWERGHDEWKAHTHLQPQANYLERFYEDVKALKQGKTIKKPMYDHTSGTFTEPLETKPNEFVVISGLHPFWLPEMRELFDVKIFLQPNENLRWHWKILRDMGKRGYNMDEVISVLRQRERDSVEYILPQAQHAHLVIVPYVGRGIETGNPDHPINLRVKYLQRGKVNLYPFTMALREIDTVDVESFKDNFSEAQSLDVGGTLTQQQVEKLAYKIVEKPEQFLSPHPQWREDYLGLFQVLFLLNLKHAL